KRSVQINTVPTGLDDSFSQFRTRDAIKLRYTDRLSDLLIEYGVSIICSFQERQLRTVAVNNGLAFHDRHTALLGVPALNLIGHEIGNHFKRCVLILALWRNDIERRVHLRTRAFIRREG